LRRGAYPTPQKKQASEAGNASIAMAARVVQSVAVSARPDAGRLVQAVAATAALRAGEDERSRDCMRAQLNALISDREAGAKATLAPQA